MRQTTPPGVKSIFAEPPKPSRLRSMRLLPKPRRDGLETGGPPDSTHSTTTSLSPLSPGNIETAVGRGQRAILGRIGRELVKHKRQNRRQLGKQADCFAAHRHVGRAVRPQFHGQDLLEVDGAFVRTDEEIVGDRERTQTAGNAVPDLVVAAQFVAQNGVNGCELVLDAVTEFVDHDLTIMLFFTQLAHEAPVLRGDPHDGERRDRSTGQNRPRCRR